jgi:triosephosphate isomerase (TIM)
MLNLKKINLKDKRILLRCDFNVPLSEKGIILDDTRIKKSLATINYLLKEKGKVILISHISGTNKNKKYSLKIIIPSLEKLLNQKVKFLGDCLHRNNKKEIERMRSGEIVLLENLRFYPEEKKGNLDFAEKLAGLADIYVNEAFSVSHRPHASIQGIPRFLPSAPGFLFEKELKVLSRVSQNPERPLTVIVGGNKVDTKVDLISGFLKKVDHLLVGSKPAAAILSEKGILVKEHLNLKNETIKAIEKIEITHPKLHLPIDGQMALKKMEEGYFRIGALGTLRKEEDVFDIGPETRKIFVKIIKSSKTIIWNGSLGIFEKEPFDRGTRDIAEAISRNYSALKIAGGGDTVSALSKLGLLENFDYISSGGGAMLVFISGGKMPGIEALNK